MRPLTTSRKSSITVTSANVTVDETDVSEQTFENLLRMSHELGRVRLQATFPNGVSISIHPAGEAVVYAREYNEKTRSAKPPQSLIPYSIED